MEHAEGRGFLDGQVALVKMLQAFIDDWRSVGSVAPTSRFVAKDMLDPIDFSKVKVAVELGAGVGNITRSMLRRMRPDARLVSVEINPRFIKHLRKTLHDPRLVLVEGSAEDLPRLLRQQGFDQADCIVCAIPFASLPKELRERICEASAACLAPGGKMTAVQYSNLVLPKLLRRHFGPFEVRVCWLNLPPAWIYECTLAQQAA